MGANFVIDRKIQNEVLPLGFTFSFPLQQEGLAIGRLVKWTKGFNSRGWRGRTWWCCSRRRWRGGEMSR